MSEHTWVLENIAGYLAGGLEAAERERLETHCGQCQECAAALGELGGLDRSLGALFAGIRPRPALEDRMIQTLRRTPVHSGLRRFLKGRAANAAAAAVILGGVGAGVTSMFGSGMLRFPGERFGSVVLQDLAMRPEPGLRGPALTKQSAENWSVSPVEGGMHSTYADVPAQTSALGDSTALETLASGGGGLGGAGGVGSGGRGLVVKGTSVTPQPTVPAGNLGIPVPPDPAKLGHFGLLPYTESPGLVAGKKDGAENQNLYFVPAEVAPTPPAQGKSAADISIYKDLDEKVSETRTGSLMFGVGVNDARKQAEKQGKETTVTRTEQLARQQSPAPGPRKIVIRSGEIEFEITSFDAAVATVTQLVSKIPNGFIATVNSEKLPNNKVRGSVVVRVPPEALDSLVLDLRKSLGVQGELKGMRIGSQDITKQFTDSESRLRAARAMEERLLAMIKSGKGEIKDLLAAEKELGVWRTRIEEIEGELRYFQNQVALSTLTLTLYEKEIKSPFAILETERVQMGLEVEDVEKAHRSALAAVAEAKGRITKSEMKQHAAGQYSAVLNFETSPEAAGPLRDRLKQLGTVARLDVDRARQSEGGTGPPADAKTKQQDTQFFVSIYNLANVAPRETVLLSLAANDVEAVYRTILARVQKASGRVLVSNLSTQKKEQAKGELQFEIKTADADAVLQDVKEAGEVLRSQTAVSPDTQNVTRSKRGFNLQIFSLSAVAPRESTTIQLAADDVPGAFRTLQEAVGKLKGRILNSQLNEQDKRNVKAELDFEARRDDADAVGKALAEAGDVYTRNLARAQDGENVAESKGSWKVSILNVANIPPRETLVMGIEVVDVDRVAAELSAFVNQAKGKAVDSKLSHEPSGRTSGKLVYDVPLSEAPGLVEKFRATGKLRSHQETRNPQVPDSKLATARLDVSLANTDLIVPSDEGLWPQIRKGLTWSFTALAWSVSWIIVGVCVILPWALLVYGGHWAVTRLRRKPGTTTP